MQLLRTSCWASQLAKLALLFVLLHLLTPLCSASRTCRNVPNTTPSHFIPPEETPTLPLEQSLWTKAARSSPNTTIPAQTSYIFRLLEFQAILTSSTVKRLDIAISLERTFELLAVLLLDFDYLEAQNLMLRFGDLTIDFYSVGEQLSILAIKAVLTRLAQWITLGLFGFVVGEVLDVQAEVRMGFAFGLVGGH